MEVLVLNIPVFSLCWLGRKINYSDEFHLNLTLNISVA
jgi:hypothetical protein